MHSCGSTVLAKSHLCKQTFAIYGQVPCDFGECTRVTFTFRQKVGSVSAWRWPLNHQVCEVKIVRRVTSGWFFVVDLTKTWSI